MPGHLHLAREIWMENREIIYEAAEGVALITLTGPPPQRLYHRN